LVWIRQMIGFNKDSLDCCDKTAGFAPGASPNYKERDCGKRCINDYRENNVRGDHKVGRPLKSKLHLSFKVHSQVKCEGMLRITGMDVVGGQKIKLPWKKSQVQKCKHTATIRSHSFMHDAASFPHTTRLHHPTITRVTRIPRAGTNVSDTNQSFNVEPMIC